MVATVYADEGPTAKRIRPRAQGRAYRIRKRTTHITVVVEPSGSRRSIGTVGSFAACVGRQGRDRSGGYSAAAEVQATSPATEAL